VIKTFILLLFSFPLLAAVTVKVDLGPSVNQGELTEASLSVISTEGMELQKLKGQTIGKTMYFYDVSPIGAQAKVIFIQVPNGSTIEGTVDGKQVVLDWSGTEIIPTEAPKELIFGTFDVPKNIKWALWITVGLAIALLAFFAGRAIFLKQKRKRTVKERLKRLKSEILERKSYEEVVELWKQKHEIIKTFPHIKGPFDSLQETLNRHQFKPRQSESEKIEVMESYRKFCRSVEGGFIGI
jgi:hypothetical protein